MSEEAFWKFLLSLTIAFPAIVGLIRYRKINLSYRPILIYVFFSLLSELIVGLFITHYGKKIETVYWHSFNLFEAIILLFQFYYWKNSSRDKTILRILMLLILVVWVFENFITSSIYQFNAVYLIAYSFFLVLLSVQTINNTIVKQDSWPLVKNATFIICISLIIYFIYNIFVFTLLAKGITNDNKMLMAQVFQIRVYINAVANLLLGVAFCFIPKKFPKNLFKEMQDLE